MFCWYNILYIYIYYIPKNKLNFQVQHTMLHRYLIASVIFNEFPISSHRYKRETKIAKTHTYI